MRDILFATPAIKVLPGHDAAKACIQRRAIFMPQSGTGIAQPGNVNMACAICGVGYNAQDDAVRVPASSDDGIIKGCSFGVAPSAVELRMCTTLFPCRKHCIRAPDS